MPLIDRPDWWGEWVDKHVPNQPLHLNENMEMLHIKCRELACNYIEQKIIAWLNENKVKFISAKFEEYSNSHPAIEIRLPYKDTFDRFYVTFNRNNWYKHICYWVPTRYEYHTCYSAAHKKNKEIISKLQEYLPVKEIEQTVNFPFKCPHRSIT